MLQPEDVTPPWLSGLSNNRNRVSIWFSPNGLPPIRDIGSMWQVITKVKQPSAWLGL